MEFKCLLVVLIFVQSTLACKDCIHGHAHDRPTRSTVCSADDGTANFGEPELIGKLALTGTSSLAASRKHPGYLYSVDDNGDGNVVRVLDEKDGAVVGVLTILGATNHDWEEMSVGVCQDDHAMSCMYIQDGGDYKDIVMSNVYVVEEPNNITGNHDVNLTMTINYSGWNSNHSVLPDCCTETIFIDPNGHIYFFNRHYEGKNILLYKLFENGGVWTARPISTFITMNSSNTGPDGSDLSPNGDELLVQFHDIIYYFKIDNNDIVGALGHPQMLLTHMPLTHMPDPDSTSVAWAANVCGFYVSNQPAAPKLIFTDRTGGAKFQPPSPPFTITNESGVSLGSTMLWRSLAVLVLLLQR